MKQFFKQLFCRHKWELRYVKTNIDWKYAGEMLNEEGFKALKSKRVAVICKRCGKELPLQ